MHTRAVDAQGNPMEGFGSGNFVIDWDAADTLPQHDTNVGQMAFTYSRLSPTTTVTNNVTFTNILDNCDPGNCKTHGQIFDAVYSYAATPATRAATCSTPRPRTSSPRPPPTKRVGAQPLDGDRRRPH